MASWWHRDVIAAGKLPLMLCFLAFVTTFVLTRMITRLIRDGRGLGLVGFSPYGVIGVDNIELTFQLTGPASGDVRR